MIPHTIMLESGLVVYKVYNGYWFFGRAAAGEALFSPAASPVTIAA